MHLFVIYTVDGITNGMVYAAVALALVMIWRATRIINYAQGAMAMFTTYIALVVIRHGAPYWLGFVIALATGMVLGAVTERVLVRPVESRPPLNAVILSLGVLILLEAVAPMLFGGQTQSFPVPVSNIDLVAGTTHSTSHRSLCSPIGAVLIAMLLLFLVFQRTTLGLAHARRRVQSRDRAHPRHSGRQDAHPRMGTGRAARRARRDAGRTGRVPVPEQHG